MVRYLLSFVLFWALHMAQAQDLIPVAKGWANNSVNTVVFRKNSLVTAGKYQFIAFYDADGFVTLGKRKLGRAVWTLKKTSFKGNVSDAHNSISIMVDGNGFLHISWDHHGNALNYARSSRPYSLEMGKREPMTGKNEGNVTYPEFFRMPDGHLLFMYRDGSSGRGNLVLNTYDLKNRSWTQLQKNLIDGENNRNAYWQAYVDNRGVIHLSWVWRETWMVETNHDMCYAKSEDGGKTWKTSAGKPYALPINATSAEYACLIPQNSELINQTTMTADNDGNPYIATYYSEKGSSIPQYHIVYHDRESWKVSNLDFRKTAFSLKGGGTKRIPISRPQLVSERRGEKITLKLFFRDEERGSKVSMASCSDLESGKWAISDLTDFSVGSWEPSFDTELWRTKKRLHLFVEYTEQADGEGKSNIEPQMVYVLDVKNIN
jgi:hypothetical protein